MLVALGNIRFAFFWSVFEIDYVTAFEIAKFTGTVKRYSLYTYFSLSYVFPLPWRSDVYILFQTFLLMTDQFQEMHNGARLQF